MATCKIKNYTVGTNEEFFFDTNVWMFIFAPLAGSNAAKQGAYSNLFSSIQSRGAFIWITSLVIAEYINAVLRLEFKQWKHRNGLLQADFKHDFRPTEDYKVALGDIKNQVSDILRFTHRHPDDFHTLNVESMIDNMGDSMDYGDAVFVDYCRRDRITLVTDDTDIVNNCTTLTILTA